MASNTQTTDKKRAHRDKKLKVKRAKRTVKKKAKAAKKGKLVIK